MKHAQSLFEYHSHHMYISPNAVDVDPDHPVLVDKYLDRADELDVDALCDKDGNVVICGIMQVGGCLRWGSHACCLWDGPPAAQPVSGFATRSSPPQPLIRSLEQTSKQTPFRLFG